MTILISDTISAPSLAEIIPAEFRGNIEGWLADLYAHDSGKAFDRQDLADYHRVAAVWTVARFWGPPRGRTSRQVQGFVLGLARGEIEVPSDLASAWSLQNTRAICALETTAIVEAREIRDALRGIYLDVVVERQKWDYGSVNNYLLRVLNRRDILESFADGLWSVRSAIKSGRAPNPYAANYLPGEDLDLEIQALDNLASRYLDFISANVDATEDLRCRKAGRADPDCWWGRLAYSDE